MNEQYIYYLNLFSWVSSGLVFLSPLILYHWLKESRDAVAGHATALGILGTFLGIFLGLMGFDVHNIANSVPQLLSGLKTAFLTSIAGMIAAMIVKIRPQIYGIKILELDEEKLDTVERMILVLTNIQTNQLELAREENEQLKSIERALCGDGETTLLTQIQRLRITLIDKQDELLEAFKEFATKVSELSTKALVDALAEVIRDFNKKLTEQFGENFKELNNAVKDLLVWQNNYKSHVEQMTAQFERTIESINQCKNTLESIVKKAEDFTTTAVGLEDLLFSINEEHTLFKANIQAFSQLSSNAKDAFPIIENNLTKLTKGMSSFLDDIIKEIASGLEKQKESISNQSKYLAEQHIILNRMITDSTSKLVSQVDKVTKETESAVLRQRDSIENQSKLLAEQQNAVRQSLTDNMNRLTAQLDGLIRANAERIAKQVSELDKQLGDELTKSVNTLGMQLTALSKQFVTDYQPLTERLREVVEIAKNVGSTR